MSAFDASKLNLPFMKYRLVALGLSAVLIVGSFFLLATKGVNLSVDFVGGLVLQVQFEKAVNVAEIRNTMIKINQGQAVIQAYDDRDVLVRLQTTGAGDEAISKQVLGALEKDFGALKVLKIDKVGPVFGRELRQQAFIAVTLSILGILGYMAFRFSFRFGVSAVLSLVHDAIIMLGVYSLTGREISTSFIAAILTVIGYSLNDSIVVLDRIRENWGSVRSVGIVDLVNNSINQTLSRTINTSLTTLLPVLAMFFLGGEVISNLAFAFLVGIGVGTYSSIYIASAVLVEWCERSPKH